MKTALIGSALAATFALASTGTAMAASDVDVLGERLSDRLTVRVGFADLDLSAPGDRGRLVTRVRGAVREVCQPFSQAAQRIDYSTCRSVAWNGAQPQMDEAFARAQQAALTGAADTAVAAVAVSAPAAL